MRKFAKGIGIAACLICTTLTSTTYADEIATGMTLYVNGVKQNPIVEPYAVDGHTLVPIRTVAEALGANVQWNQELQRACIELHSTQLVLTPNSNICIVDGVPEEMPMAVEVQSETCMVPIRFIAEKLHFNVDWLQESKKIIIEDNFEYQTSFETDQYGHQIRKTDLTEISQYFPYLQEGIPNWAYQGVVNSWNNNAWGYNFEMNGSEYAQFTKLDKSPIEVNRADFVDYNYLLTQMDTSNWQPESPKNLKTNLEAYEMLFNFIVNMNYEDAIKNDYQLLNLWLDMTNPNSKGFSVEQHLKDTGGLLHDLHQYNMKFKGTFKLMPEASFRPNTYIQSAMSDNIILPVYIDLTVENNNKDWTNFPGYHFILNASTQTEYIDFDKNFKTGTHIQGVIYLPLILNRDTNIWGLNYEFCDITSQLIYNIDLFNSLTPFLANSPDDIGFNFAVNSAWRDYGLMSRYERCLMNVIPYYNNNPELVKKNLINKQDILYYPRNYLCNSLKWDGVFRNDPFNITQTNSEVQALTAKNTVNKTCYNATEYELIWIMNLEDCDFDTAVDLKLNGKYKNKQVHYEDWLITLSEERLSEMGFSKTRIEAIKAGKDIFDDNIGDYLID